MSYSFNAASTTTGKQYVGLSCQAVGVGSGGSVSMLARVSLVDFRGKAMMDTFVLPTLPVVSYRTSSTGITEQDFARAKPFERVQADVCAAISGKIIIGHTLWQDLHVLGITHPALATRDLALYLPFREALRSPSQVIGLQTLVFRLMRRVIQANYQDSMENARACVDLFRSHIDEWESVIDGERWPCALPPQAYSRCYS